MKRILYVADVNGWAYWHVGRGLKRYAPAGVDVAVVDATSFGALTKEMPWVLGQFDAVVQGSWLEATYGLTLKRSVGCLGSHGIEYDYPGNDNDFSQRIVTKLRNRRMATERLPQFDRLLCFNKRLVTAASAIEGVNPVYCLPGVDPAVFHPAPKREWNQLRVGWCAQPGRTKGYDEVFTPLVKRLGDQKFLWNVMNLSAANAVPHEEVARWQREQNDVFVSTSFSEGCQNTILEAMATGLPVIATTAGAAPECVGTAGFIVPNYTNDAGAADTVDRMAKILLMLHGERKTVRDLGAKARARVETELAWEHRSPVWCEEILK